MEAIDLRFELDETQRQYRDTLIRRLKQDPAVLDFLQKNRLDERVLETSSSLFYRWQKQRRICQDCRGLAGCSMPVAGSYCDLQADEQGFLNEVYRPCRYKKQENSQMAHRANFTLSHMQGKDYLISFERLGQGLEHEQKHYMLAYTRALSSISQPDGCLFYGQPGTGKSTLLMALANEHARIGRRVVYIRVPLLISQLKENLKDDTFRRQTLSRMRLADVLFLDDFGSESASAWSRDEILFPILDERMNNHKKTYFASNIQLGELEKRYVLDSSIAGSVAASRMMDRVRALSKPVELLGASRRRAPR